MTRFINCKQKPEVVPHRQKPPIPEEKSFVTQVNPSRRRRESVAQIRPQSAFILPVHFALTRAPAKERRTTGRGNGRESKKIEIAWLEEKARSADWNFESGARKVPRIPSQHGRPVSAGENNVLNPFGEGNSLPTVI